jgi:hypothetical protein
LRRRDQPVGIDAAICRTKANVKLRKRWHANDVSWKNAKLRRAGVNGKNQRELEEIPPTPIDKTKWPEGIRSLSLDEDALGVDAKGNLYWQGKPVETRRPLDLTRGQQIIAVIIAVATVVGALAAVVQAIMAVVTFMFQAK